MPFPLGADDDVCLVGAHRLLPYYGGIRIRRVPKDPYSFILFSCSGSGIRFARKSPCSLAPIQLSGIIFYDTHFISLHLLTLFHLQLRG